jgi:arylsulfatase A-like enzyme
MRTHRSPNLLAAALAALAALACGPDEGPQRPPNVVLLVLDTVRADHLGCYGYQRPTTPRIDALAARADRHERVESTAPWTLPSHASMFTGQLSFEHGIHAGRGPDGVIFDGRRLAPGQRTLAEALGEAGYRTAGFVANAIYLSETFGFQQGFEVYDVERLRAPQMTAKLLRWIDEEAGEGPFFAFVNFMDAHRPYNTDPLPEGPPPGLPAPAPEPSGSLLHRLIGQVMAQGEQPDPELVAKVISHYDHGIAWLDRAVGQIVDALASRGLWEDTLLIVTSDHGEYFGEHGLVEHSKDVYQPAIAVPLIVKRPGQTQGRVLPERISLADLPTLVFDQLPARLRERHGADLTQRDERSAVLAEIYYTRGKDLQQPWGRRFLRERQALYVERYKLILSSDGADELYDLEADPGESHDLLAERPDLGEALRKRLLAVLATRPGGAGAGEVPELTPEQLEELRLLGY